MKFEMDYRDVAKLEEGIKKVPGKAERVINLVLHTDGIETVTKGVTHLLPVSEKKKNTPWYLEHGSIEHAKETKWSTNEKENLGFTVKSKGGAANKRGSFGYLVFPDEGRGQEEQAFTEKATDAAMPQIINKLHGKLTEIIGGSL